jgi:acyl carrier protein
MTAINGETRDVAAAVREAILAVYRDTGRPPRDTPAGAILGGDLGLDSLDLAQIIVLLERSLGVDPFREARSSSPHPPLRTVEHLVTLYAAAIADRAS